jgi:hypothetical protein
VKERKKSLFEHCMSCENRESKSVGFMRKSKV